MALSFIKQKEKQRYFVFIFLVLLFFIAIVLGRGYFFKGEESAPVVVKPEPREIKINFELLGSDTVKALEVFDMISRIEGGGRANPFIPY